MPAKTRGNFSISQHSITRWSLAALSALIVCGGLALVLYRRAERQLPPTIAGWRAVVTTLAGDGVPGGRDGPFHQARFHDPFGIVIDRKGNLYVVDAGDSNSIRRLTKEGVVITLAGGREGFADGRGDAAAFNSPSSLAIDHDGSLFVADTGNNRIRKITPEGMVTTLAGDGNGITVYGNAATRFLYEVSNIIRDGESREARWEAPKLLPGEYVLRIIAADLAGNEVVVDLPIIVE